MCWERQRAAAALAIRASDKKTKIGKEERRHTRCEGDGWRAPCREGICARSLAFPLKPTIHSPPLNTRGKKVHSYCVHSLAPPSFSLGMKLCAGRARVGASSLFKGLSEESSSLADRPFCAPAMYPKASETVANYFSGLPSCLLFLSSDLIIHLMKFCLCVPFPSSPWRSSLLRCRSGCTC